MTIGDVLPTLTRIYRLPNTSSGCPHVISDDVVGYSGYCRNTSTAGRTDTSVLHCFEQIAIKDDIGIISLGVCQGSSQAEEKYKREEADVSKSVQ
jgi:hypothetical protein